MTAPTLSNAASASGRISAFPKSNSTSACKLNVNSLRSLLVFERYFEFFQLGPFLLEIEFRLLDLFFLISSFFSACVGVVAACCPRAAPTAKKNRAEATAMAQVRAPSSVGPPAFWELPMRMEWRSALSALAGTAADV